ncbi:MAG TPA: HAD family hydrolase [bacterium]|nr:HAD family hydrolase [bacterium]
MRRKLKKRPAVFFDRDGTLIKDVGYLKHSAQVKLFSQTVWVLKILRKAGFYLFVVTNQSGVARGYFSEAEVKKVHQKIRLMLKAQGAKIDAFFYCPHHPQGKVKSLSKICNCRKPSPGMVKQALRRYPIDLKKSYAVGDKLDDVLLARNAKLAAGLLVRTGNGRKSERELKERKLKNSVVVSNLTQAAKWILSRKDMA